MKKILMLFALYATSSLAFAASDWQLLCVPGSHTGCHSLWTTESINDGKGTLLFSYNIDGTEALPVPSIVIDIDNATLAANTTHLTFTAGTHNIDIPVVAADHSGVMASFDKTQLYSVSKIVNALQANKTVTLTLTLNDEKTPTVITINTTGFNANLPRMMHGDALFATEQLS